MTKKSGWLPLLAIGFFFMTVMMIVIVRPPANALWKADAWHYQLQNYEAPGTYEFVTKFLNVKNMLIVIDYSRNGSDAHVFRKDEVELMKNNGKNTVLAYLSIGEAEEYRYYYPEVKNLLKRVQNPLFKNNHRVEYWDARWQKIIVDGDNSYVDRIVGAGFDGIYLDLVDAYTGFMAGKKDAAVEMIRFISKIAIQARKSKPNFIVVVQNAPCILQRNNFEGLSEAQYRNVVDSFSKAINGISLESTFYFGRAFENNSFNPQKEVLKCLDYFYKNKKRILAVEYLTNPKKFTEAMDKMTGTDFLGLITDRKLEGKVVFYADKRALKK